MSTDTLEAPQPSTDDKKENGIVKLNITDTAIAQFKKDYMSLTVNGIEDKAGLKKVYEARQEVKSTRVGVEKYGKKLKEDALEWQRKVNAEEKRVVGELKSIEAHLQSEEDKIEEEKERIRKEAEAAENARIQVRIDKLAGFGFAVDYTLLKSIDDESFDKVLANAKSEHAKEQAAIAERERLAAEEAARLKAEREELEALRKERAEAQRVIEENNARIKKDQDEKEAAILAEQKNIEDEKNRIAQEEKRNADLAKAREEAAEAARLKAIADAKKDREEKEETEKQAKLKAERDAALRPDKEKLEAFAKKIGQSIDFEVSDPRVQLILNDVSILIGKIQTHIYRKVKEL